MLTLQKASDRPAKTVNLEINTPGELTYVDNVVVESPTQAKFREAMESLSEDFYTCGEVTLSPDEAIEGLLTVFGVRELAQALAKHSLHNATLSDDDHKLFLTWNGAATALNDAVEILGQGPKAP